MFFSNKKGERNIVLILDIQSSVVRGSLVIVSKTEQPRVIFTHSADINFRSGDSDSLLIKATLDKIRETIQFAQRFLHHKESVIQYTGIRKKITAIHYVLSSPWIVSEAKVLSKKFDKETEITQKYVCDLIAEDREKMASSTTEPLQVIEQKIFDVRLNNYSICDWEGKMTKVLDVSFTVSVAGKRMVENFIDQCLHIVRSNRIHFHSSLLLQYIGIEKILEPGQNYCLIHVHGDETDVSIVKQKACIFFGSFSIGVRTIVGKISQLSNLGEQTADSLITLYTGGKLEDDQNTKNIESISTVSKEWFSKLKEILMVPKLDIKPPMSVIVTAWTHEDLFVKLIKDAISGVSVYILSIDDLIAKVSFDGASEKRRLTALHAIAIHSLEE